MHLPTPPERVYATLDSDAGREAFWAERARERDGVVEFVFVNNVRCRCRIVKRQPPHLWRIEYIEGVASFELTSDGRGGTDLMLRHDGIPPDEWQEVHAGWLNVLFPLKAWLVHGVDLRNHDAARSWDEGYADQ
jgi:uncharacterized protein YndB with AHSA1/START domain